mmetsp:Transcript_40534/g.120952  ORF Transcript_40534/g.120952 Transcript_40534/m.120952 type:complete len:206 (+) Transcript_40534:1073-1690(+)
MNKRLEERHTANTHMHLEVCCSACTKKAKRSSAHGGGSHLAHPLQQDLLHKSETHAGAVCLLLLLMQETCHSCNCSVCCSCLFMCGLGRSLQLCQARRIGRTKHHHQCVDAARNPAACRLALCNACCWCHFLSFWLYLCRYCSQHNWHYRLAHSRRVDSWNMARRGVNSCKAQQAHCSIALLDGFLAGIGCRISMHLCRAVRVTG